MMKKTILPIILGIIFILIGSSAFAVDFVAISDTHNTKIPNVNAINSAGGSFVIHLGDFTDSSSRFGFDDYSSLNGPVLAIRGNHDSAAIFKNFWQNKKPSLISFTDDSGWPLYYSFDDGGVHFIAIDYQTYSKDWLKSDLSKNSGKPTVIFTHVPAAPIDCGVHPNDVTSGLKSIVEQNSQVKAIISGHQHCSYQTKVGNAVQIVVGTSSADIRYPTGDSAYKTALLGKHLFASITADASSVKSCGVVVETGEKVECSDNGGSAAQQKQLTLRQKIAQMMMTTPGVDGKFVSEFEVGGLILMRDEEGTGTVSHPVGDGGDASADEIKKRVSTYQSKANIPLLVSSDVEGGVVNRISKLSEPGDPRTMGDAGQITQKMTKTGQVMKELGINMDLAPVVDVAPNSPGVVMATRAFSDDPNVVKEKGAAYIQGLHASGVAATLKHFPGYGDEKRNSDATFVDVPGIVSSQKDVFDSLKTTTDAIMMSNIIYKKEDSKNQAVVSPAIVGLARQNFDGVIISDDLGAKSLLDTQYKGDIKKMSVDVVKAGVDILLIVNYKKSNSETEKNIKSMIDAIEAAVNGGEITEARIDESVARILALKQKYASYNPQTGAVAAAPLAAKDCVPGTFYGGSSANVNVAEEGWAEIPLMDGEQICFDKDGECKMKASAVQMLYPLYKLFKDNGCTLHITGAYRSLEDYRYNWVEKVLKQGRPAKNYCGPSPRSKPDDLDSYKHCPHYQGYAIDIASSYCPDQEKRVKLACEAGWINLAWEGWHFEYGSSQWNKVKKTNVRACQIGGDLKIDKDPVTNPEAYGAKSEVPSESLSFKELNKFGGLKVIEADPTYFDVKTMSAKTIIEDIGGGSCSVCTGEINDLKSKYTGLNIVAGVNAAYFSFGGDGGFTGDTAAIYKKYGRPTGFFVENGKWINGSAVLQSFHRYFIVENGVPNIISIEDFEKRVGESTITSAVTGSDSTKDPIRPRTMVCITNDGKVKLALAESAKISEMFDYLKASENCKEVLNLDGGGSTQMYYNWNGISKEIKVERPVASFVVVVPKSAEYGAASYSSGTAATKFCPPGSFHNEGEDEILYAAYLISGAFSTVINYTLAPYAEVQSTVKDLVTLKGDSYCGESTSIDCLADKTAFNENFNFSFKLGNQIAGNAEWNKFCESPEEQFFSEFGEMFDTCIDSGDYCSCTMDSSATGLGSQRIQISKVSETKYVATLTGSDKVFTLFTAGYAAENMPSEIISTSGTISINKEGNKISLGSPKYSSCIVDIGTMKVCAVSKNVAVEGVNPIAGNFSNNSLTFRFAFFPPNTPPPDVKKVTADDLRYASNMVMLSWYKSAAKNIIGYNIYQDATADFAGRKSEDEKNQVSPVFISTSNEKIVNSLSATPECMPKGNKLCTFALNAELEGGLVQKIMLSPGTLIFENSTNKYYYIMALADKTPKYVGVTAINKKNLESVKFIETPKAESIDDLPPGPVNIKHVPDAINSNLTWERPQFNIDGSLLMITPVYYDVIQVCTSTPNIRISPGPGVDTMGSPDLTTINNFGIDADCQIKAVIAKKEIKNLIVPYSPDVKADLQTSVDYPIINYLLQ